MQLNSFGDINISTMIKRKKLKALIKAQGYTQESFAEKVGLTRMGLIRILKIGMTRFLTLKRIAKALHLDLKDLLK